MEPLDGAVLVVTADHLAVADLVAEAVDGLVGVDRHVEDLLGDREVGVEVARGGGRLRLLLLLLLPFLLQTLLLVLGLLLDGGLLFLFLRLRLR